MVRHNNAVSSHRAEGSSSSAEAATVPLTYLAVASADFEIEAKWNAILKSWQTALGVTTAELQRERRSTHRRNYHRGSRQFNTRNQNCEKGGVPAPLGEGGEGMETESVSSNGGEFMTGRRSPVAATSLMSFVLKVDCNHGRILHASSSIKQALSLDNESIVGQTIEALLHPDDLEDFMLYCRCPSEYITCLPQITKGSISAVGGSSSLDSNCHYVTFLCRMLNGHHGPNDKPQYTVVRVSGKQQSTRVEEPQWPQSTVSSLPALCESENMTSSTSFEKTSMSRTLPKIQKIFFSLVEVPTVSLKLELAPNPEQFSMREYMLTTDQSPTILFADPRIERILGFSQVEVVGRTGYDIVMPKDQLFIVAAQFDAVLKCREPTPVAARLRTKGGKTVFSRSRVYLNLDHWTGKIKNYVTISSVISKRTAYKYFQRQIRIVHILRKNREKWNEMLNLLNLTDEQKLFVSKMDLNSYLEDFRECIEQFGVDRGKISRQGDSFLETSQTHSGEDVSCSSEEGSSSTKIVLSADQNSNLRLNNNNQNCLTFSDDSEFFLSDESSFQDQPGDDNFKPTPHIPEVFKFFPADFRFKYKVSPVSNSGGSSDTNAIAPQSSSTIDSSPLSVSSDFSPLITSASTNGLDTSSCNLLESSCKLPNFTNHRVPPHCFDKGSLTRSLLSVPRDENKPAQDFSTLATTFSDKITASHLQNVKMALSETRPQKYGSKFNQKRFSASTKRARKSINHS